MSVVRNKIQALRENAETNMNDWRTCTHPCCFCGCCCVQAKGIADAEAAAQEGMKEMSEVFKAAGAEVYLPTTEA